MAHGVGGRARARALLDPSSGTTNSQATGPRGPAVPSGAAATAPLSASLSFSSTAAVFLFHSHTIRFTHLKCTVQWFFVYTKLCNHHHNPLERISTPLKEPPVCFQPRSQPQATTNLPSVSTNVPLLDTSWKRNQTQRVFSRLHHVLQVRPRCSGHQHSTS